MTASSPQSGSSETANAAGAVSVAVGNGPSRRSSRYKRWEGELASGRWSWWTIVLLGVRRPLKSKFVHFLLTSGVGLVVGSASLFYILSIVEKLVGTQDARFYYDIIKSFVGVDVSSVQQLGRLREPLWQAVFFLMIRIQMVVVLFTVAFVAPALISKDLKTKALPIYFSKPITPITYLLGKWCIVAAFIAGVMLIPNLAALCLGTLLAGGLETWGQTLSLAADLVMSGVIVCLTGGAIALALSSLTADHRFAVFGWLVVCVMLSVAQTILNENLPPSATNRWLGCVSLWDNVLVVTDWLFGMRTRWQEAGVPPQVFAGAMVRPVSPGCAATVLAAWTLVPLGVCYRRVVRFSRSAANL